MGANLPNCDNCAICKGSLADGEIVLIHEKGADGINAASVLRGENIFVNAGCKVHVNCRKQYINKKGIKGMKRDSRNIEQRESPRITAGPFVSKSDCLFCGTPVCLDGSDYSHVKTDSFVNTIIKCCETRSDEWSFKVRGAIEYYKDLYAAGCIYHHVCSVNFRTGYDLPHQFRDHSSDFQEKRRKCGRPKDAAQELAFSKLCSFLEISDEKQLTMLDLREKMREILNNDEVPPYSHKFLKQKLLEHYGDMIFISDGKGTNNIVTFREKTSQILRSFYEKSQLQLNEELQKNAIIDAAARLIKTDIKENIIATGDHYPKLEELTLSSGFEYVPESLRTLLTKLFVEKQIQKSKVYTEQKVASIGQAIVQAVRPRSVIAPLQIGLAVQMYHHYRSRFLLETLNKLGFCSSYDELLRFQKIAASCSASNSIINDQELLGSSCLFVADNVDHNTITIDGKGTFHGMGMIAALTPAKKRDYIVSRKEMSELQITEQTRVDIMECSFPRTVLRETKFKALAFDECPNTEIDILWEISFRFKQSVPNWQGMMHVIHKGKSHPGQSSIHYLPMINMAPGDRNCILSALEFIFQQASKHNVPPIVTFDQPLFWNASEIIKASPVDSHLKSVVLMLGSFHTLMNLLGAIGTLMDGTGLKNILEVIYGENAVAHILSGKAIARAIRGHLIVDNCLHQLTVKSIVEDNPEVNLLVEEVEELYLHLLKGEITLETVTTSSAISHISALLKKKKSEASAQSKTSKLWVGYQDMLSIARLLIKADRTGSWKDHLHAMYNALPIFAAAGHYNYLKSAYLYLQEMTELENHNPEVYNMFQKGLHVIRRSNQFWAGLGCDLVIEQTLMRSLKSSGGLTHGSKMTESQRALWTMSAPIMSDYNVAMQEFSDLTFTTSEQYKESSLSRMKRDSQDMLKVLEKLTECSPFTTDPALKNIVSGVVAKDNIDVHEYESVGRKIINKMLGEPVFSFTFTIKGLNYLYPSSDPNYCSWQPTAVSC